MKNLFKGIKKWILYKICYFEISYGKYKGIYKIYTKQERQAIAYNMITEYLKD